MAANVVQMLKESTVRLENSEPGDSTKKADFLERLPCGRSDIEKFLNGLQPGKPASAHFYDATSKAVIIARAMPISGHTTVTMNGFKNVSHEQYKKFISEADLSNLTGLTSVKLAAEKILGVRIP